MTPDDTPIGRLDPEVDPSPHLERKTERSLRARGLLAPRTPAWFRLAGAAAAALLLVAGGFWLGAIAGGPGGGADRLAAPSAGDADSTDAAQQYVLLLYEGDDFRPTSDEQALVAENRGWAVGLAREGTVVAGERLDETGILLERPGGEGAALPGGDHGSRLGRLDGYFVISAADRAEALAIAGTNPHLRHGGRIVVRPIVPT
jgi:hypothetical protein